MEPLVPHPILLPFKLNMKNRLTFSCFQGLTRKMKEFNKLFDIVLDKIIDEDEQDECAKEQEGNQQEDFIHVMMSLMNHSTTSNQKSSYQLDRSNIKAILQDMLAAGMEALSTTIEWIFSELLRHPRRT